MDFLKESETEYSIRLDRNEDIIEALTHFAIQQNITSGQINGIGAIKDVELGVYNLSQKQYERKFFPYIAEVLSLTGNISLMEERPFFHLHVVLSDDKFQCYGGHLFKGVVALTLELKLKTTHCKINRKEDEKTDTGLNLLSFE